MLKSGGFRLATFLILGRTERMNKIVFVVANVPTAGTHLINSITGVYSTEEQALKNIKDDGDIIMTIPLDKNDDGRDTITGWYPRLELKEKATNYNKEVSNENN